MPPIQIKTYENAKSLFADLSATSDLWGPSPTHWIFRGQSDANWELIPSAFRKISWESFNGLFQDLDIDVTNGILLNREFNAVRYFATEADRQGLQVPGFNESWLNLESLLDKIRQQVSSGDQAFPLPEWRSLFAMAQHYGIPTRLLDWTESAKIAAYFASIETAQLIKDQPSKVGKEIAIWAINIHKIEVSTMRKQERIVSVHAPWSSNPNLRAQKGLFTLFEHPLKNEEKVIVEPLEQAIPRLCSTNLYEYEAQPLIYSLHLKSEESPELLELLLYEGINRASLFPGYSDITKSLVERQLYIETNSPDA